ncbi:efflux RND transporter permease subunit [Pseudomonas sp. TCU-HL1]|uniref:efflux RND transporter permease subunit n=1 Tax=Pseudomonas sp. TCU-HL1 TaxID=1856685 RepID=UPI00083E139A|nr:efflux RND transporter permease subunit [Pseudomonas sp. TCU-HL1]AOE86774.1 acriflavin resistance protein [Pseudomonas sp. TCU-HL1]
MSFPNLSALAVRERAVTLFLLMLAICAGVYAFLELGRAEDPAFTVRAMIVTVRWPGATPDELQTQVVDRLEKRIQEVEHLYKIDTTILQGQAHIQVEFEDYTTKAQVLDLQYQVRKRMEEEASSLPVGVIGPTVNDDFGDVYFSLIALTAPGMPLRELSREAEQLRDRLQLLPGVHKAQVLGERQERVFIEFDNARLSNLGISPEAVFAAIDANNRLLPAGRMESRGPRLYLRLDTDLSDLDSLAAVPFEVGGRLLKLSDIAMIRRGYEDPPSYLVRSQGQEALLLGVVMADGANGLALGEQLASFIETERQALPLGMSLNILTNQAEVVASAVNLFQIKFLIAVLVVVAVSVLAIGWRAGLVVGIAVPLTLCISFVVMLTMDINLDRITLGALIIALGLLVDDAIIAVEMMLVKMEAGYHRAQAAAHAWTVTAAPMLFGTLITVAGFLPIGFAHSSVGEYAGNLFWVLLIALTASWLVAVIFVPYLGVKLLPEVRLKGVEHGQSYQTPGYRRLRRLVSWCVRRRKTVVAGTLGLLALSMCAMVFVVQKQFFPISDRPEVMISVYMPQGSSVAATDAVVHKLEALLVPLDEVRSYSSYTGAGAPRFFITANPEMPNSAFARIIAIADDANARDRVMARVRQAVAEGAFPEARIRVVGLLYGTPVNWPVELRLVGPDPLVLREIGHRVRDVMAAHPNMVEPHLEWDDRVPVLHLAMDTERLRLMGLTPQAVSQALQFQLDGLTVTSLRQDIRTVDVVARLQQPAGRFDADRLAALEITTPDNRKLPLRQLGKFEIRFEESMVKRFMRQRSLTVQGEVAGAQASDVSNALWAQLAPLRAELPAGYRLLLAGTVEASERANGSIEKLQPLMIAIMLILIMLQMRSFSGAFMVAATAPLGLIGAALALLLFHQPFGFVALLGLTGLAGIMMRNTLILTQQVNDNFAAGMEAFEGVVEAAVQRARPVVLTALAAVLAFIPLTHDAYWGPLAYVLIGGVAVGTLITLLLVPALYALWFRIGTVAFGAGVAAAV